MTNEFLVEQWKIVEFDFDYVNDTRIEVSNYGRVRSFNKIWNGRILVTPLIKGYPIIRLRFFRPRNKTVQKNIDKLMEEEKTFTKTIKALKALEPDDAHTETIKEAEIQLAETQKKLTKKRKADLKNRAIHYHSLIHRLVATYFLPKPNDFETVVSHLDYNKLNNRADNLKWMTVAENQVHQKLNPKWIDYVHQQKNSVPRAKEITHSKLTVTKVMLLKKMLNQGKPMKQLVKQFKVTETQIYRVKRGENWSNIPAAN